MYKLVRGTHVGEGHAKLVRGTRVGEGSIFCAQVGEGQVNRVRELEML